MNNYFNKNRIGQRGFTLIELMVSISIFLIILLMGLGAYSTTIQSQKKASSKSQAIYSMHYVFDIVMRNLRTGFSYRVPSTSANCTIQGKTGGESVIFSDQDNNEVTYRYVISDGVGSLRSIINGGRENFLSDRNSVNLSQVCFYVTGTTQTDDIQPGVLLFMKGNSNYKGQKDEFSIQTFVSQRLIDIDTQLP